MTKAMIFALLLSTTLRAAEPVKKADEAKPKLSKAYWTLVATQASTMVIDFEVTQWAQHRDPTWHELNPAFGPRPSRARMYGLAIPAYAGMALWSAHLHKKGSRFWWAPLAAGIAGNCVGTWMNIKSQRRIHNGLR